MHVLDVRRLQRDGLLTPDQAFEWQWTYNGEKTASIQIRVETGRVILSYQTRSKGGQWQKKEYPAYLEWTGLHFGGRRAWFRCPAQGCGRRVAILYGGSIFACRHCHNLIYPCQRETADYRALRRADRIRQRLEWDCHDGGLKPKGMHWRTFEQLIARHDAFMDASLVQFMQRFGNMGFNTKT